MNFQNEFTENDYGDKEFFVTDVSGFDSVAKYLNNKLPQNKVKTSQKVTNIATGPKSVKVATTSGTFTGKHVIVTASVGVMQSNMITFNPPLPDWKVKALKSLKMTSYTKVYVVWE